MRSFNFTSLSISTLEKRAFWFFASLVILSSIFYAYFIASAVVHVIVRKEVEQDIVTVSSKVSELESAYLARTNELTRSFAAATGFAALEHKSYASRDGALASELSFNSER